MCKRQGWVHKSAEGWKRELSLDQRSGVLYFAKMLGSSSPSPSASSSKSLASWLLAATAVVAFFFIYLIPPSSQTLFDAFTQVRLTGSYPDGLSVRRTYIGIPALDEMFTGLAGFFSAATDGRDLATHLFCLWFLPQLCGVLVFIYWEAGKTKKGLVRL